MTQAQVSGVNKILAYHDSNWSGMSYDQLAYVLATVTHETGFKMAPVTELGSPSYLKSKKYYPWIGRGLIQITWKTNYLKFNIKDPDDALKWPVALDVAFRGMVNGMFTGKKLSDFINNKEVDFEGARQIINGMDRAKLIAHYAYGYQDALEHGPDVTGNA